jgi:hypothetical protein
MTEAQLYEIIGRLVVEADALRAALAKALAENTPADLVAEAEAWAVAADLPTES